ncbi:Acylphosphatase [Sinomonas atrocyanea]|jgi:acylphosphatase|uniref:acylphosphatase n=1 Tax=Sinomonas atrocyanea TaxID=37927 RepID=A0A126ZWC6_9MICC|nr:acylphosphatase [Sinomonas atrocyanea]AMM31267.1 Acylphosphatase [Sinomonas atrocyanea]GEB64522.1 acylphosphatase [Sinomonas atrocyanea]GGG64349.1 acylphosphatase [Sinomonas atrocyanea]
MSIFRRRSPRSQSGTPEAPEARLSATVSGMVQGVGFRFRTLGQAERLGLVGSAGNHADGTVEVVAEGAREDVEALLAWLRSDEAPGRVDEVRADIGPATGEFSQFSLF